MVTFLTTFLLKLVLEVGNLVLFPFAFISGDLFKNQLNKIASLQVKMQFPKKQV